MYYPHITKRSGKYGNNYITDYSPKINREVVFNSELEREHWVLVETNPYVKEFVEQPIVIEGYYNNRIVRSIPDMWIKYNDQHEEIVEVKYSTSLIPGAKDYNRVQKQLYIQKRWCEEKGISHHVITEKEILKDLIYVNNLKMIIKRVAKLKENINEYDCLKICEQLSNGSKTIQQLIMILSLDPQYCMSLICWLLYNGIIVASLNSKYITFDLEVFLEWIDFP